MKLVKKHLFRRFTFINTNCGGFTLIELLVVIAILGILAVFVTVSINPMQKILQSRDAGRITGVNQYGRYSNAYYTTHSEYPLPIQWDEDLSASGDITSQVSGVAYNLQSPCTTNSRPTSLPTYCYDLDNIDGNGFILFTILESDINANKCGGVGLPYYVYSSSDSRSGIVCLSSDPTPWPAGSMTYVD